MEAINHLLAGFLLSGLAPPPDYSVCEWAEKYRILPSEGANEAGPYRVSRTPYLKEVMECLSPSHICNLVVFMKGSQIGATEAGLNWIHYIIDHSPAPMLLVQPTVELAKIHSKQRLSPSLRLCQKLRGKISDNKSRRGGNTVSMKNFPGGTLILAGANSAAPLRSMPIKYLFGDEIDNWPPDVDGEGDPLELGRKRTATYPQRKIYLPSTPLIAGLSRVEEYFNKSDQRYYFVPCPHCGFKQIIKWENIKYDNRDSKTVRLICINEKCQKYIYEYQKEFMLANGEWIATNPKGDYPGFHLSALYSPLGWYSWIDAVADHLASMTDPKKRQVWVNTVLGETYELEGTSIDSNWLEKRQEKYTAQVPTAVLCITCGVDVQEDRLEASLWGFGVQDETWLITHKIIWGETTAPETWQELDTFLLQPLKHERGHEIYPAITCIDAAFRPDETYKFCKDKSHRRVFAVRGYSGQGKTIITRYTRNKKYGVYLFQVGVDQAKATIYSRLKISEKGPGYVHLPDTVTLNFLKQLVSEKRHLRRHAGLPVLQWVLPAGRRNEGLDCAVYGLAGLHILNPNLDLLASENLLYHGKPITRPPARRRILSKGVQ